MPNVFLIFPLCLLAFVAAVTAEEQSDQVLNLTKKQIEDLCRSASASGRLAAEVQSPYDGINMTEEMQDIAHEVIGNPRLFFGNRLMGINIEQRDANQTLKIHDYLLDEEKRSVDPLEAKFAAVEKKIKEDSDQIEAVIAELRAFTNPRGLIKLESDISGLSNIVDGLKLIEQGLFEFDSKPPPEPPKPCESCVPLNYVYCQLPKESEPKVLYPNTEWTDISADYANLFFRVEGNNTLPFGEIQEDQTRQLSKIECTSIERDNVPCSMEIPLTGWSDYFKTGLYDKNKHNSKTAIRIRTDDAEVRPRNTAIRCFKRTK